MMGMMMSMITTIERLSTKEGSIMIPVSIGIKSLQNFIAIILLLCTLQIIYLILVAYLLYFLLQVRLSS